jgi:hypothetical protein
MARTFPGRLTHIIKRGRAFCKRPHERNQARVHRRARAAALKIGQLHLAAPEVLFVIFRFSYHHKSNRFYRMRRGGNSDCDFVIESGDDVASWAWSLIGDA